MTATLTLILATHNGAAHLPAQLHSFIRQTRLPDLLLVSDDGSGDATRDILADFARTAPFEVRVTDGPCRGYGRNFAALLAQTPAGTGHVALSDQDDIWLPHKLARACARLDDLSGPALYGSRSWEAADEAAPRRLSRGLTCPPSFRHALARNYAGGNTMVLNRAGADLMRHAARHLVADPVHDWWIYQVITGCGGRAIFDDEPGLIYRQYGTNQIGANGGARGPAARARPCRRPIPHLDRCQPCQSRCPARPAQPGERGASGRSARVARPPTRAPHPRLRPHRDPPRRHGRADRHVGQRPVWPVLGVAPDRCAGPSDRRGGTRWATCWPD